MKKVIMVLGLSCLIMAATGLNGCKNATAEENIAKSFITAEITSSSSLPNDETTTLGIVEENYAQFEGSASEFEENEAAEENHDEHKDVNSNETAVTEDNISIETTPEPTNDPKSQEKKEEPCEHLPEVGSTDDPGEGAIGEWE